ncbi:MAG: hypothetical protein HDS56_02075 [Barnesiella sp.]|nr:hypothetical protein [Barnesiella sp.]MBD5427019.1 hypothetical protein [Treponema sp.]
MRLKVNFDEVSAFVKERYGKSVALEGVGEREVKVTYEQKILFKMVSVSLVLKVEEVRADGLTLAYDGRFGLDTAVSGLLTLFKSFFPELAAAVIPEDGHRVRVELSKVAQAQKALEMLALKDVWVTGEGVSIEASLK